MWRPGFEFTNSNPAKLSGYHRRLSVYSNHYRGTDATPGLVFGLDRGGSCAGLAYCISDDKWSEALAYVRAREMIGGIYREVIKQIEVADSPEPVMAVTYVVVRGHQQFAPVMPLEETLAYIHQGYGTSGSCLEYVTNTIVHLRELGIHDSQLEKLGPHLGLGHIKKPWR